MKSLKEEAALAFDPLAIPFIFLGLVIKTTVRFFWRIVAGVGVFAWQKLFGR